MRSFRMLTPLVKNRKAKTLSLVAGLLLVLLTSAYAVFNQTVSKYPTGYVLGTTAMGSGMTLEKGSVFGFNSAKSGQDSDAYATIQEGACLTPMTTFDFTEGREGFTNPAPPAGLTYGYSGVEGYGAGGALQTRLSKKSTALTYTWNKSFLWDCGTPLGTVPVSIWYRRGATWNLPATTNTLQLLMIKPDLSTVNLTAAIDIDGAANSAWTQVSVANIATNFTLPGMYTLKVTGILQGTSTSSSNMFLFLDDFNVGLSSNYSSYTQDVEFTIRATPYSSLPSNAYRLDIRARKTSGDTSEDTNIQVCGDALPTCASWTTRYTVPSSASAWTVYNSYYLTAAEYNNGNVRVRYVDATPSADGNRGGIDVEYQRVTVDQGTCVDSVRDIEADCGKCHNYNGDISKPWPNLGMHHQHAQSESISDCLWCHPDNLLDSAHSNGAVTIAGTKVFRVSDGNLNGAPATANYDGTTKQCSNVACHMNLLTPAWNATFVSSGFNGSTLIARNCSRCHNSGAPGADNASNLNINVSWPNDAGGGHASHNAAVAFDEYSCQTNGSCHTDNRGQHSVVGDGAVVVKMAPNYGSPNAIIKYIKSSATSGDGICVNVSCHGGQATPKFRLSSGNPINLAATNGSSCILCHIAEQANGWGTAPGNASQYNSPISGLHRGSPPTSGQDHSSTLINGCQACHTLASLTRHFQFGGVTNLDSTAMDSMTGAAFVASVGYVAGSADGPNFTNPPTCVTTSTTTCHAENQSAYRNTQGLWKRKWAWDSYAAETPDTEKVKQCNGCHGHWGTFVAGVVQPHVMSNTDAALRNALVNNHADSGVNCGTMCHAQGATSPSAYNHGVAVGAATKDMTLNANATIVNTGGPPARVGCSGCHAANDGSVPDGGGPATNHVFAEAGWGQETALAGPTPTCYICHGGGTAQSGGSGFNYWPDGAAYPDLAGGTGAVKRHQKHIEILAAKRGYTMGALTDQEQKTMCAYCHPYTSYPGEGGHGVLSSPADVTSAGFRQSWATLSGNYPIAGDTGTAAGWNTGTQQCSGIDCHNNKATTGTLAWNSNGTSTCIMCHSDVNLAGDLSHTAHLAATVPTTFGETLTCASCHDAVTNWATNTPPPAPNHMNGTFTATNYTGATYPTVKGYCNNNTCHNNGKGAAVPSNNVWGTAMGNCTGCHGDATTLTTEAHGEHLSATYASTLCTDCHTSQTAATHLNGFVNFDAPAKVNYNLGSAVALPRPTPNGTCSTVSCHNRGTPVTQSVAWNTVNYLDCNACHFGTTTATTGAANLAHPMPLSTSHNDHLDKSFLCSRCHTVPGAGVVHWTKTTLAASTVGATGEAAVAPGAPTSYTWSSPTCTNAGATPNNGIGCHATAAPAWGTTITMATGCTNCHTNTTNAAVNPTSGLHNITAAGPQRHDSNFTGGCTACHNSAPPATHINGSFIANSGSNGVTERFINRSGMLYTETAVTLGRSGTCSGSGVNIANGCHTDNGNWFRLWSTEANSAATATSSQRCNVCHGQWSAITNSAGWAGGTSHYKGGGINSSTSTRGGGHDTTTCDNCHAYGASGNGRHNVVTRQINLNNNGLTPGRSGNAYGTDNAGCNQASCHTNGWLLSAYNYPISYFPQAAVAGPVFPVPTCTSCHDTGSGGAPIVNSVTGTHIKANGIAFTTCEACHAGHADGTAAGSNVIYVSTVYTGTTAVPTMTKADGVTALYGSGTHGYRIRLGGTTQNGGAKSTEAEWCWGCHDFLTTNLKTLTGVNVTFTSPATIAATGIDTKFNVGDWITISGSSNAANNRTFKVATEAAGSLTVTNQTGDGTLATVASAAGVTIVSPISEWGVNEDTATGGITYDYGELYTDTTTRFGTRTSNWVTGSWRSGKGRVGGVAGDGAYNPYWYKRGAIKSTHAANYDAATATPGAVEGTNWKAMTSGANAAGYNRTETLDSVGNIRCSYCHDVHGNHNTIKGDPAGTTPYLRGTWKGNPYAEDGAPQWGMGSYRIQGSAAVANNDVNSSQYGIVPRASASTINSGLANVAKASGFWIDQNSASPNAGSSSTLTAGLCDQCHGSVAKDGTWTAAEIGTIDLITGENLWISGSAYNGHGNSVISGSGGNGGTAPAAASAEIRARNIFTRTLRGYSTLTTGGSPGGQQANMGLIGASRGYSYRGTMAVNWLPKTYSTTTTGAGVDNPYAYSFFAWGTAASTKNTAASGVQLTQPTATGAEAAHDAQLNFHTFTCSKCHNPHASRLPKLMITNCLDTNHNTWEDNSIYTGTALSAPWTGLRHSQWASAQNCHRVDARAVLVTSPVTTLGGGWNKATPWQESTAPNTATGTNPNP